MLFERGKLNRISLDLTRRQTELNERHSKRLEPLLNNIFAGKLLFKSLATIKGYSAWALQRPQVLGAWDPPTLRLRLAAEPRLLSLLDPPGPVRPGGALSQGLSLSRPEAPSFGLPTQELHRVDGGFLPQNGEKNPGSAPS